MSVHAVLETAVTYIEYFSPAIILSLEGGLNILANIRKLHAETSQGNPPESDTLRNLEAYVRQHKMKKVALSP